MSDRFRVFGSELSPYSVKVRSYLRYKGIPHDWVPRSPAVEEEFRRYARLPLIPLVVTPEDEGLQDSTPILETLEARVPEPSIHPEDPVLRFLSALLEEFADEWGNKWMFHFRWWREADQRSGAERIARAMLGEDADADAVQGTAEGVAKRMVSRLSFVGSNEGTAGRIEGSFAHAVELLEAHMQGGRPYLFGGRPAFADFGLWGQLYNCWTDPTPGERLRADAPRLCAWIERMLEPRDEGPFDGWPALVPTLEPLLRDEVGGMFLPWSTANAAALAAGEKEFSVVLGDEPFTQETQKYHAKSLRALRERYAAVPDTESLDSILERTGCLRWLRD